ncbi:MAG: DUF2779 domain-containing protein [Candidatus Margulisiibacteriota bacterium]|nr:DUF2779 domain-containing protein [Candidatus Margulisiibacteriota bacterium]
MYNRKDQIPPPPPELEEVFKQGRIVGEHAQQLFPDGIKIGREFNPNRMSEKSLNALFRSVPVFEAGFVCHQAYALADILVPAQNGSWDLIEVKSSTGIKEEHLLDAAFQKYVYSGAGVKVNRCYLMHLNKEYIRNGDLEVDKLFKKVDVSEEVEQLLPDTQKNIGILLNLINGPEPNTKIGMHCSEECPLWEICTNSLPKDNIFNLRSGKKIALALFEQGIIRIRDIPEYVELNKKQKIQLNSHLNNKPYVNKAEIKAFLDELAYPLYFLDFETIAPAIPTYDQTHPYQDIPFQYSLHVQNSKGSKPIHYEYLAPGDIDPRPEVLKQLKDRLGSSGSIVAYNAAYELKCIGSSVKVNPGFKSWFDQIRLRFADLLIPFKNFYYYHPEQLGSASLKKVLPALTDESYEGMEIGGGRRASAEYLRITFDKGIDNKERREIRRALTKYCGLDTRGMIDILDVLEKVI